MGFREIKQTSRRRLHDKMKVAANHYVAGNVLATPTLIYVRAHNKNVNQGDQAGTSLGFAEVREDIPKVIFDLTEIIPARLDVVIISATEGYRIKLVDPEDGEFVTTQANRLSAAEIGGYSAP